MGGRGAAGADMDPRDEQPEDAFELPRARRAFAAELTLASLSDLNKCEPASPGLR